MYHLVTFDGEWRNLTEESKILRLINIMVFFTVENFHFFFLSDLLKNNSPSEN